jgi:long-chain fatty acid transport protein
LLRIFNLNSKGDDMRIFTKITIAGAVLFSTVSTIYAGPYGYDLHNTLSPAAAGMAGTSIARAPGPVSAVFGNPATMADYKGTQFTFGATFYKPEVALSHDGSVTGTAFDNARSGTDVFPVPQVAVTQDLRGLNIPATLGLGLTATSGIGAEFRKTPGSLGAGAEFVIFGVNAGLGYDLTDNLSVGGAATISFAQMDLGLSSTGANTHDLGLRATVGATYDIGKTTIGTFYQTEQEHKFDSLVEVTPGVFDDTRISQPANFGIGIANDSLMGGNLLLSADFIYKKWEDTDFWQDIFEDQKVYSLGAQLTSGNWKYRLGYGYADDPTKENVTAGIGSLNSVNSNIGVIPVSAPVVEYLQAAEAEVIYKHRLTAGLGYANLLGVKGLDVDTHFGYQFSEERDYGTGSLSGGGHTKAKTNSWHSGFGVTWRF